MSAQYFTCKECGLDDGKHANGFPCFSRTLAALGIVEDRSHHLQRRECHHGLLSRSCDRCEDEKELDALRKESAELRAECTATGNVAGHQRERAKAAERERDALRHEVERLTKERDEAKRYPTVWAYEQACSALHKKEARAAKLEGALKAACEHLNEHGISALDHRAALGDTSEDTPKCPRCADHGWIGRPDVNDDLKARIERLTEALEKISEGWCLESNGEDIGRCEQESPGDVCEVCRDVMIARAALSETVGESTRPIEPIGPIEKPIEAPAPWCEHCPTPAIGAVRFGANTYPRCQAHLYHGETLPIPGPKTFTAEEIEKALSAAKVQSIADGLCGDSVGYGPSCTTNRVRIYLGLTSENGSGE